MKSSKQREELGRLHDRLYRVAKELTRTFDDCERQVELADDLDRRFREGLTKLTKLVIELDHLLCSEYE
jgi:hypothetical protein